MKIHYVYTNIVRANSGVLESDKLFLGQLKLNRFFEVEIRKLILCTQADSLEVAYSLNKNSEH